MPDAISEARRTKVGEARTAWVRRLVDTSRRNSLLYFRELRAGTLDFGSAREGAIEELLMGAKVPLRHLLPDDERAALKLRDIARRALSNREEKGLETLYLAYGMATWPVDDGGRPPMAAAVLVPIAVEGRAVPLLVRSGPPRPNLALLHVLAGMGYEPDLDEESEDAEAMVGRLGATVPMAGFHVFARAVLGNFSFQKLAMVRDLQDEDLAAHDLVASLAGDSEARASVASRRVAVDPRSLDEIPPSAEFMPLDADSSQQSAIHAVARGSDGVIQGPPGCGKSQTIANLVATLVAQGKRVLFVAEKRAALEAVHKRLEAVGLGHLALDLHGATLSQRGVVARIGETLASIRTAGDPDDDALNARYEDRRARLVAHDRLMHTPVAPSGRTPYTLQAALLEPPLARTRWRGDDLARLTSEAEKRIEDLLEEAQGHRDLFLRRGPWGDADLTDGSAVQVALDAASELTAALPAYLELGRELAAQVGTAPAETPSEVSAVESLAEETNRFLERWDPALIHEAEPLSQALKPLHEGTLRFLFALAFNGSFRAARRRLGQLRRGDAAIEFHSDLQTALDLAHRWRAVGIPAKQVRIPSHLAQRGREVWSAIAALQAALPGLHLSERPDALDAARRLLADAASARAVPRVRAIERELTELGAAKVVEEIRAGEPSSSGAAPNPSPLPLSPVGERGSSWPELFRDAWLRSCHDALLAERPELAGFSGEAHERVAEEFRRLDRERTTLAAARVRRAHAEAAVAAMNAFPAQADLLRGEAQKRSRHRPLRRLLAEAPDVLPAVCPCWMASPLNVSGLLPARDLFDVVVFDEASQVLPEDAVGAILRGKRLVVAGDRHQLPPTTFFADGADDEEEPADVAGYQSLLDGVGAFLEPWPLLWHYRSRDERLIAFSNRFVYGDRLVTFPGVGGTPCVSHVLVDAVTADEESSATEVSKVVELVLDHAATTPDVSLGVIAMGIKHAQRIEAALDRALDARPELEPFFDPQRPERFFVKNLEQVQGDERDAIVISVGYGKSADGRLPYRFGPLLQDGGERRLNVAATRARERMTVVSSFSHLDMAPDRSKAKGVVLLREFLAFAAGGGRLPASEVEAVLDPFERDVVEALTARGMSLTPHHGLSALRVELAAKGEADRFVLALESDGPSYHAGPTARDRDRLRPQQLEALGWRTHRIWSPEWVAHREREIERAVAAWQGTLPPPTSETPVVHAAAERAAAPIVAHRDDIEDVPLPELDALVRWVDEGGVQTDDEIVDEVAERLGYVRVGAKIDRTVRAALSRVRKD